MGDQVQDDFGIAGGLEDGAFAFQILAKLGRVSDVAVMGDGDASFITGDGEGLGVEQHGIAGGGVTGVADGNISGQAAQNFRREQVGDTAHAAVVVNLAAVAGGDAGAFLAAVLERVQAEVGDVGGLGMAVDGEDSAFFVQLVIV